MNREEAERKYKELLQKIAKYNLENNMAMVSATFKEIEKVRARILNLDVAEAIAIYENQIANTIKVQK